MKKYGLFIMTILLVQSVFGQDREDRILEQVEAQKVAYFTQVLDLSLEESQSFWPIYNAYQDRQKELKQQFRGNFRNRNMNDEEASKAIADYFTIKELELDNQKQLYAELKGIIPPSRLVKLHFAEQQFKQKLLERIKKRRERRK